MPAKYLISLALLTMAYFIAGKFGLLLASIHTNATPVWPPTGIALAVFVLLGLRVWPAIFTGAFLVNQVTAGSVETSLSIAVGNTLEGVAGAYMAIRWANGRHAFERISHVFTFVLLTAIFSTMISATVGVTSLAITGQAPWQNYGSIWCTWWLGNTTGDLLVAPVLLLWCGANHPRWTRIQTLELSLLMPALVFVGLMLFGGWLPINDKNYPIAFLSIPFLVWIAYRFGPRETATGTLLLSITAIGGTLHGFGPFARISTNESLLLLETFMSVTGVMAMALAAGVAERKHAEAVLRQAHAQSEERVHQRTAALHEQTEALSALIQAAPVAILSLNPEGQTTRWNPAAERIFGWSATEVLGKPPPFIPAAKLEEFRILRQRVLAGETLADIELQRRRKDGSPIVVHLSAAPLRHADGRITGVMGTLVDFTEWKVLEEQVRQSQKMEAVGRLAGGIAHDFNNLLMVIMGYTEMLLRTLSETDPTGRKMVQIRNAGKRASELTAQLLAFSRRQVIQPRVIDLNAILLEIDTMLQRLIGENIQLFTILGEDLGFIKADPGQMEQVVVNLIVNARDAMPQGGKVIVETSNADFTRPERFGLAVIPAGHYVTLVI
ncbi:MAG: MASE1 domain-containing protein, partial [Nitrospiraceae bacterium]